MNTILSVGTIALTSIGLLYGVLGAYDFFRPFSKERP